MNYITQHLPSRTLTTNNQEYLWFSGTSYLGMPHHQGFRENFIKAFAQYGTSWGSSRNNTIRLEIYEKAEIELAKFAEMPAALTVSSGMLAGQLVCSFLQKPDTQFFYAPKTHPALWNEANLKLEDWEKGLTYADWSVQIAKKVKEAKAQNIVICTDAVGSPYVEYFDFQWIKDLPKEKDITIVIDASHSFGVNHSIIQSSNCRTVNHSIIITSSLNKAMGMTGGVIFSDSETMAEIRKSPMFSGASPMMPALLETFVNSIDYFREQQQKLMKNIAYFNSLLPNDTFLDSIENYPAYCTHQSGVHEFLKENGIMTACFPYPTANDLPVTRLVVSALHGRQDLEKVALLVPQASACK
ncbi:MAG: aminotransferase class I/II-fold pyridoxal phosphate-dependent enzyme [Arcicella sp.]|jgi:7-keto-8-aminopelargonate synthetase-like enzyme|nr:aminotransferase class I/II-fold pyridoxal phosphate-dependent enzyme [Arcicella sp.]